MSTKLHRDVPAVKRRKLCAISTLAAKVEPALDDRASWGPEDVAQDVVPRVSSTLVTGAARSRIKIQTET